MHDVRLFRLLRQAGPADPVALVQALDGAAARPIGERFALLGLLGPLLDDERAFVRAAAVRFLAGAAGRRGLERMVRALDDESDVVRAAAVGALRTVADPWPMRWAHAVFHPDRRVRSEALARRDPEPAQWLALALAADPATAEEAHRLLRRLVSPMPLFLLPILTSLRRAGVLADDLAREVLGGLDWRGRADELIERLWPGAPLVAGSPVDAAADLAATLDLEEVLSGLVAWFDGCPASKREPAASRIVAALDRRAAATGYDEAMAALAVAVDPARFLTDESVDPAIRGTAARTLYRRRTPPVEDAVIERILTGDVCRRPSGTLDLAAAGGVLGLLGGRAYSRFLDWFGLSAVMEALAEDPIDSAPFFCVEGDDPGRRNLVAQIDAFGRFESAYLRVLQVINPLPGSLDGLEGLGADEAIDLFAELRRVRDEAGLELPANKVDRLIRLLATAIVPPRLGPFLAAWTAGPTPESDRIGMDLLGGVARQASTAEFLRAVDEIGDPEAVGRFLIAITRCPSFPYDKESALAHHLADHADGAIQEWARARLPARSLFEHRVRADRLERLVVAGSVLRVLQTCTDDALADVLRLHGVLGRLSLGLATALGGRPDPVGPVPEACLALLGCGDDPVDVARQFERFAAPDPAFLADLDRAAVTAWQGTRGLPFLGHAWLHRWELHAFAFGEVFEGEVSATAFLSAALDLPSDVLVDRILGAFGRWMALLAYRHRHDLEALLDDDLAAFLVDILAGPRAGRAAACLTTIARATRTASSEPNAAWLTAIEPSVVALLPDLDLEVRRILSAWIDVRGLAARPTPRRRTVARLEGDAAAALRRSTDLVQLARICRSQDEPLIQEAALRLVELDEAGRSILVDLLTSDEPPPGFHLLVQTIPLWPAGRALDRLVDRIEGRVGRTDVLFLAGLETGLEAAALVDLAVAPADEPWLRPEDWDRLAALAPDEDWLALRLAASPHPHGHERAVGHLLGSEPSTANDDALVGFLDSVEGSRAGLRLEVARHLVGRGRWEGWPLVVAGANEEDGLPRMPVDLLEAVAVAAVMAGCDPLGERLVLKALEEGDHEAADVERIGLLLLEGSDRPTIRQAVLTRLEGLRAWGAGRRTRRAGLLGALAETVAYGIRTGRELTGKMFRIRMLGTGQLGYTRLEASEIFVSPLPILRGERGGRAVVRGLICHEIGHHVHHADADSRAVWKEAEEQRLHGLLNLVSDEHLERNLRAVDDAIGDDLKQLAAYAFQHAAREIEVERILSILRHRSFAVLSGMSLAVARDPFSVRVESGALLLEMERAGHSFARFVRSLRMGLGNRHGDPLVGRGLALFRKRFRRSSMADLFEIAVTLREIFGSEVDLLDAVCPDAFLGAGPADIEVDGHGLGDEDIEREVERILGRPEGQRPGRGRGGGPIDQINVAAEEEFEVIRTVVHLAHDRAAARSLGAEVALQASQMKRYLVDLGLALVPRRGRLRGQRVDRPALLRAVVRRDPRVLVARERVVHNDLFLGIVVDCSGSMSGERMTRARRFAALLTGAARGLEGIDVRIFGFTDQVIYDAGDSDRPAAHALEAGGGNNDAAGLWHAAREAMASRRRARLLVMISDGLPTECSVEALRALVRRLIRRGVLCAQVAVAPLSEVAFPDHVEVRTADDGEAVRRFGRIVAGLIRRALA